MKIPPRAITSLTAQEWVDRMLLQMMEAAGVTEELKAYDQMAWIGLVVP